MLHGFTDCYSPQGDGFDPECSEDFSGVQELLHAWFPQNPKKIAVALSGGVDSMALTYILHQWAKKTGETTIVPLIVDHGLRPESDQEAHGVAHMVRHWGLDPVILRWQHPRITTGLMERARYGRYATLAMACHHRNIDHLCVGHHQDDVLETVWMRQAMKGSEYGLSGMSAITMRYGVMIVRPLLFIPKIILEKAMKTRGISWVNDPTNHHMGFHRSRARQSIDRWNTVQRVQALHRIQTRANERCARETLLRQLTCVSHGLGYVLVHDFMPLCALSVQDGSVWIQSWVHSFTFRAVAGLEGQHRLWRLLQEVFSKPLQGRPGAVVATFGGCVFVRHHEQLWIFREHARISDHSVDCSLHIWDDRVWAMTSRIIQRSPWSNKGSWIERFSRVALPHLWDPSGLRYNPCSWPYPHFSTIQNSPLPPVYSMSLDSRAP